jgi:hypothetical protein
MAFVPSSYDSTNQAIYKLTFDRLPNTVYTAFSVNIPGISLGELVMPTPINDVPLPGDKITFEPFTINFLVQENLENYLEIFNWIYAFGKPIESSQYKNYFQTEKNPLYSDAELTILSNKYNPLLKVNFIDCWPQSLGELQFDSQITSVTPITIPASFRYSYFTIESLS